MPKVLFIWNISSKDGNIGSYRPSVYAAKSIGYDIDIAMNFSDTSEAVKKQIEEQLNVHLIHVDIDRNPFSLKNMDAYKQLVSVMQKGEYDIVHCNTPVGSVLGRLVANKIKNKRVFYMNRGFHFYKGAPLLNWLVYYNVEKVLARFFTDAIATINPQDFEYAEKFTLRNKSNIKYSLPGPGVELSRFVYDEQARKDIRKEYGYAEDDVVIISVGELSVRKNFGCIIEAMGKLQAPNLHYLIVGEGELEGQLKAQVKTLNLEVKVKFAGYKVNVAPYYSASDIFALPSLNEGFGRVGIEAMNIGLPLITSNIQGINLYSINGKTGFKCEATNVDEYAKGIRKLLESKELRKQMSSYNKEFAREFDMKNTAKYIAEVYQRLMDR